MPISNGASKDCTKGIPWWLIVLVMLPLLFCHSLMLGVILGEMDDFGCFRDGQLTFVAGYQSTLDSKQAFECSEDGADFGRSLYGSTGQQFGELIGKYLWQPLTIIADTNVVILSIVPGGGYLFDVMTIGFDEITHDYEGLSLRKGELYNSGGLADY